MIAILPVLVATEGWDIYKKFMNKRGYKMDWIYAVYFLLAVLIIFLIVLLVNGAHW
jgi:high-affinity Fe2+/Pb2+ permease